MNHLNPPPSLSINKKDIQFLMQETTTLIVKNLPNFSETDLLNLLKRFGPNDIRLGKSYHLKNSAFLDFPDRALAAAAYSKIQELGNIGGKNIRVEYALPSKEALKKKGGSNSGNHPVESIKQDVVALIPPPQPPPVQQQQQQQQQQPPPPPPPEPPTPGFRVEPIAPSLGLNYPAAPTLHYRYPPPTVDILYNVMNAIAAVPKLYTQVLHLMNKMNLPPPFKPVVPESIPPLLQQLVPDKDSKKREKRDELLSDDESEIDSEEEDEKMGSKKKAKVTTNTSGVIQLVPPIITSVGPSGVNSISSGILMSPINPVSTSLPYPYMEQQSNQSMLDVQFPVSDAPVNSRMDIINPVSSSTSNSVIDQPLSHDSISIEEINNHKMPTEELQKLSIMKNYVLGEPTKTLYIKNLSQKKKVEEKDLKYIFGRYFQSHNEMESQLEIQLLSGRMRGQAFIKLPSIELATQALNELHGYVLRDKPMVIQFSKGSSESKKGS